MSSKEKPALMMHEWLVIVTLIGFVGMLTIISVVGPKHTRIVQWEAPHHIISPEVTVSIQGAVAHPGSYQFKRGVSMQEVLDNVKPLPEADLKKIQIKAKIRKNQKLYIPKKRKFKESKKSKRCSNKNQEKQT